MAKGDDLWTQLHQVMDEVYERDDFEKLLGLDKLGNWSSESNNIIFFIFLQFKNIFIDSFGMLSIRWLRNAWLHSAYPKLTIRLFLKSYRISSSLLSSFISKPSSTKLALRSILRKVEVKAQVDNHSNSAHTAELPQFFPPYQTRKISTDSGQLWCIIAPDGPPPIQRKALIPSRQPATVCRAKIESE